MKHRITPLLAFLALSLFAPASAFAACASPAGNEGEMEYNSAYHVMQFCNGSIWVSMACGSVTTTPSTPTSSDGYFVITSGTWNGNLGGIAGADAKCLSDLTANNWMGKTDASNRGLLNSTNVKAFICSSNGCVEAVAGVTYYFAVSGAPTKGGASFTADGSGGGPGNTADWSGANYFAGFKEYWTSRDCYNNSNTSWWDTSNHGWNLCSDWTSASSADTAVTGSSSSATCGRWYGARPACDLQKRLVCFVHP